MTLQNITISTINNSDLYFLKADGSDFIQAPISETTHIGVLRYAPTAIGTYQGEVYANASALKQYQKFPVALTVLNVTTVDIFVSITDPSDDPDYAGWFQVGKGLPVVGTSFGLLESDVPVGTDIWVMVRDSVNAGVYDIAQSGVMSLVLTSPSAGTSFILESVITVQWTASANIPLVNIVIESATGIKVIENINASLGMYEVEMIADSGSFDFGQELVITVENSLQTIADSVTVEIRQATLQDFRIEESESEYRVAEDIHFTAYVNYGNLPSMWTVYAQYSSDGITYEDIQSATVGGSDLATITGCLIPAGASGTIYLRARVGDVYSDPIEALVVAPEIVISAVDVTVDEAFTISGTCNLAKNLRISYAKDPYSSWTVVDNSVTVQPNGTWSVGGVVISETGNFRLKAEYIQDTVSMFSDTDDVVVASAFFPAYISAGRESSFGIWNDRLYAWGQNNSGQLGIGSADANNHTVPEAVSVATSLNGLDVVSVSSAGGPGSEYTLCLTSNGRVHGFGKNTNGRLGDGSITDRTSPVATATGAGLHNVKVNKIACGYTHAIALDENGVVWAWGHNNKGQLGDGSTTDRTSPIKVATDAGSSLNGKTVIDVAAGEYFSIALDSDGNVHTWGWGASGRLGHNNTTDYPKPKKVDAVSGMIAVSASGSESHYLKSNGTIWGAGGNTTGSLGDNSLTQRNTPVQMLNSGTSSLLGKTPVAISSSPESDGKTVITCSDGTIHFTGGLNSTKIPTALSTGTIAGEVVVLASSGRRHNIVKLADGTVNGQGSNQYGKLGDNSTQDRALFVKTNDPV